MIAFGLSISVNLDASDLPVLMIPQWAGAPPVSLQSCSGVSGPGHSGSATRTCSPAFVRYWNPLQGGGCGRSATLPLWACSTRARRPGQAAPCSPCNGIRFGKFWHSLKESQFCQARIGWDGCSGTQTAAAESRPFCHLPRGFRERRGQDRFGRRRCLAVSTQART